MKCSKCQEPRELATHTYCRKCQAEYQRNWKHDNLEQYKKTRKKHRAAYRLRHPEKNREAVRASQKRWWEKNYPKRRDHMLKKQYGITLNQYKELMAKQQSLCASCGTDLSILKGRQIHLDHCHHTKIVRGILCRPCNIALGAMRDDPNNIMKLAAYISKFKGE